jgi:ATP-dependent DNA ligase
VPTVAPTVATPGTLPLSIRTQTVAIGGWRVGAGSRAMTFGSLVGSLWCGVDDGGRPW